MLHLMDAIESVTTNSKVRFILLSPIRHEKFGMDAQEIARHNETLGQYTKVLGEIAGLRNCAFVSLFDTLNNGKEGTLTDNGIHLNARGYARAAEAIAQGLGWTTGQELEHAEELRQAIIKKNELFFDRWRPQNETYLFGFVSMSRDKTRKRFQCLIRLF
jgi:hypothetical protein